MKTLFIFLVTVIVLAGCRPDEQKPIAEFTLSTNRAGSDSVKTGNVFYVGDTVYTANKSQNAFSYKWILPTGETIVAESIKYIPYKAGIFSVKMIAYSAKKNYADTSIKNLNIVDRTGSVTFWFDTSHTEISVEIGDEIKYITNYYDTEPSCNASGCASFVLPVGTYNYTATSGESTYSGTVTLTENTCKMERLTTATD